MKKIKYILSAFIVAAMFAACDRSDDGGNVVVPSPSTIESTGNAAADAKIQELFDKYGVLFQPNFPNSKYSYDWTSSVNSYPYTDADPNYIVQVLDSLDSWVLSKFPQEFIQKELQLDVLLVDSVVMRKLVIDQYGEDTVPYSIPGLVTSNQLTIADVSSRFDPESRELKEAYISLVIERIMNRHEIPASFVYYGYYCSNPTFASLFAGYWDGDYSNKVIWGYCDAEDDYYWWAKTIMKAGRLGISNIDLEYSYYDYYKGTEGQDFGDYVAFIMTYTAAEKEAFYNTVKAYCDIEVTQHSSLITPFDGDQVVAHMKEKVQIVKDFFQSEFGFTLPEP